ncbi:aspartate/glutamate racemase family protein [Aestuariibacter sp. AA17]|uniref:Aspartate/glutamate racemase family protein n=1 Tax=Fluctibacter corallii TaxID=2984329 RepID=A0ABT3A8Y0_9ALTE|nr:aspartate/glutamate racemase family protein [Aestuariibacter sp. AA17]MCV2885073.1 aspartate/glutamate racemase family protein [Aestuariibacter sp. AA17]
MKRIGLIGGMSWESTATYYQRINQQVNHQLGGLASADIVLHSLNFATIEALQHDGNWAALADILSDSAQQLEAAGADFLLICTNTMHKVAPAVTQSVSIPLLHIAQATGSALQRHQIRTVGLLGTRFTMEEDFYTSYLQDTFDMNVLIPTESERDTVHNVIYHQLCKGKIEAESKTAFIHIVDSLKKAGAEAVILGCTEIGLLIKPGDTSIPLFDTTLIHADSAVMESLCKT